MTAVEKAPTILTAAGARKLTDRIRQQLDRADQDLARAYEGRVWEALELDSWDAWVQRELPDLQHLRLTVPARRERVRELRLAGASTRAIASAAGVSPGTVQTDLDALRESGELSGELATVTSLDGRRRPAQQPATGAETRAAAQQQRHGLTILMHEAWQRVDAAGNGGLTCLELQGKARWRAGRTSSLLHRLERRGLVWRSGAFREGYGVYVATPLDQ